MTPRDPPQESHPQSPGSDPPTLPPHASAPAQGTRLAEEIRRTIVEQSRRAHVGHIGSCLSIADVMAALFSGALRAAEPDDPDRDRFILSKGHAGLALYAALAATDRLTTGTLETFCSDGTELGVHPEHTVPGIDFSTGSLGHGLAIAAGAALAARLQGSDRRAIVLMSDAECNEGSVWEAAMFASHHGLSNLVAIVDVNGQQAFGHTKDVLDLSPLADRWRTFGWDVHEVDGHDAPALQAAIEGLDVLSGRPHLLAANTVFGKGVSFMEGQIKWHYWTMSDDEHHRAIAELDAARAAADPRRE